MLQYTKSESYRCLFGIIKNDNNEIVTVNTKYIDTDNSTNSSDPSICIEYYNIEIISSDINSNTNTTNSSNLEVTYKFQKIMK